jgi:glycosyltransferase 2 family protein
MKTNVQEQIIQPGSKIDESSFSGKPEIAHISVDTKRPSLLKKATAFLVIAVILFFLGRSLYHNLGELRSYQWSIRPLLLILSFFPLLASLILSAFAWERILCLLGTRLPLDQSFKIMSLSGLSKYLPGKIWLYLSQIYLSQKVNIPKSVCLFSLLILFSAYNLAGMLVFITSLFLWGKFSPWMILFFLLLCCSLFPVIFSPRSLNGVLKVLTFFTKKFKNGLIPERLTFRSRTSRILQIILILLVDWTIFGIAVYCLVNSFYHIDFSQTVILCGIFAISSIVGIASFFVPAGLGVREGVLSYLLSMFIPVSVAILISLAMRVWMTVGELICFFVALKIKKPEIW